ncbi:MAG: hypothetical protein KF733_03530 [Fimbriimonadaceae bacterium]|nr:MAG: hypothetical protein KF733_03530 [Fimbriimonadaceae bacterium]
MSRKRPPYQDAALVQCADRFLRHKFAGSSKGRATDGEAAKEVGGSAQGRSRPMSTRADVQSAPRQGIRHGRWVSA